MRANAAASWSRVASRIDRRDSSLGWPPRLEPRSRSPIATPAVAPHTKRQRESVALLSLPRMDVTGFGSVLIEPDEISHGDWWDSDIGISKWIKSQTVL